MSQADELRQWGMLAATVGASARVFHAGYVVPDLSAAIDDMSMTLGLRFIEPVEVDGLTLNTPEGPRDDIRLRFSYSVRPGHIELIEHCPGPGSVWDFHDPQRGHHIGVFTDDIVAEANRLDARGWRQVWWGSAPDDTMLFSYHETPYGFYLELVNSVGRPYFASLFAEADPSLHVG